MTHTAKIHSKTLQIILSREDFVALALKGDARLPVQDIAGAGFGEVYIHVSPLCRGAMLEHIDQSIPTEIASAIEAEKTTRQIKER